VTDLAPITLAEATADPLTVTVQEACRLSGLGYVTLYKLMNEGKLQSVKVGNRRLIDYASLKGVLKAA
jgi:excisionase family DNA binding protein